MSDMTYNLGMVRRPHGDAKTTFRGLDPLSAQLIRELAGRHHVRQAEVLDAAIVHFIRGLEDHIQLPEHWEPFLEERP